MTRWIVAACALLAGCTQSVLTAPLPVIDPGQAAEVVIIRPSGLVGCAWDVPVLLDRRVVFTIECGKHVVYPIAAGDHVLAPQWPILPNATPFTIVAHQRSYMRIDPAPFNLGGMTLKPITPEEGERLMTETITS